MIVLTESQKKTLFQAAGRRVAATVTKTIPNSISDELGELAELPVLGAFVSFKKTGDLRSCMGCMADSMPLALALEGSAVRAAKDDPRFPPIAARELRGLDMEVWVLWGMKPIPEKGKGRANAIEIGKHGLQISGRGKRGILLPGVAVDHNMDVPEFLDAICRKAGLPNNAWYDDKVELCTFEGLAVGGNFSDIEILDSKAAAQLSPWITEGTYVCGVPGPSSLDLVKLRNHANHNFINIYKGITPILYVPDAFDGIVSGVAISYVHPKRDLTVCSKIALRADLPLQSTIQELVEALVNQLKRFGTPIENAAEGQLELTVLWDPVMHGTNVNYNVDKVDPVRRTIGVSLKDRWVVQYGPEIPSETMATEALNYLGVSKDEKAEILSFETVSTIPHMMASFVPQPVNNTVRKPAVSGAFYPSDPHEMEAMLDGMLSEGPPIQEDIAFSNRPKPTPLHPEGPNAKGPKFIHGDSGQKRPQPYSAVMIPHAGWIYSGRLAAQTLLRTEIPDRVIVFCPKHRPGGVDWAVAPHGTWELPLRNVESDPEFAARLVDAVDIFQLDARAHAQEHAIEVQLPIFARISPNTKVIGAIVHGHNWAQISRASEQFANFLQRLEKPPLLVISSDMNHYSSDDVTRRVDRIALDAIERLEPEKLLATVMENDISMCGISPAVFVLETLRKMHRLRECIEVGYTTSAARSGETQRVVGYAGLLFR